MKLKIWLGRIIPLVIIALGEVSHLNNVKYNPTSPSAIITNGIILPNHIFNFIQSTHFCIE